MIATLELEHIGHATWRVFADAKRQLGPALGERLVGKLGPCPWVALITADGSRLWVNGRRDYSRANSKGSRGVYAVFDLYAGNLYEVHEMVSWSRSRRYFCRVDEDGDVLEMTREEALEWRRTESVF